MFQIYEELKCLYINYMQNIINDFLFRDFCSYISNYFFFLIYFLTPLLEYNFFTVLC